MGVLFTLLVVAAVATWLWKRSRSEAASRDGAPSGWRVTFRDGRVARVEGHVPRNVLGAFEDIAHHASLTGDVRMTDGDLAFADSVAPGTRQQFRNAWHAGMTAH